MENRKFVNCEDSMVQNGTKGEVCKAIDVGGKRAPQEEIISLPSLLFQGSCTKFIRTMSGTIRISVFMMPLRSTSYYLF